MGEIMVIGSRTRELIKGQCDELSAIGISAAGRTRACAPYEIIRDELRGGHVIATFDGEGEFWHEGAWQPARVGAVYLHPPTGGERFRALKGTSWSFCWLHTHPTFFEGSALAGPQLIETDITLFCHAVEGFIHSAFSDDYASTASPWAGLIRYYAQRFMRSAASELRLERIWAAVASEPGRPWDITELAKLAGMSREQLRVHAKRETGRSPMQQVAHLRMQRAIEILQTCSYKQEVVAEMVGYDNAFAFSNALFKSTGKRPSFYRSIG